MECPALLDSAAKVGLRPFLAFGPIWKLVKLILHDFARWYRSPHSFFLHEQRSLCGESCANRAR